jgi:tRNA threonylcarbamoyladenosine biosynthesis protein TsaE
VTLDLPDAAATEALGKTLGKTLAAAVRPELAGWMLLLAGELGSGKTTLARSLLESLGHHGPVPSPTYTLVEGYDLPAGIIYHIDLYRITSEVELPYLGWDGFDDGLRLIEWPERAPRLTADADVSLQLQYAGAGRAALIELLSPRAIATFGKCFAGRSTGP